MTVRLAYTYDEAAEQLGVGKLLIRSLVDSGELIAICISSHEDARSKRISHHELTRFIAAREALQRHKFAGLTLGVKGQPA